MPTNTRLCHTTSNTWAYKLEFNFWNKVTSNILATKLQANIMATGRCEFWVKNIELVKSKPNTT